MYVALEHLATATGAPPCKGDQFYTRHIHQLDEQLGTRTPVLVYWENRLGVPMVTADALLAAVNNRNASAGHELNAARRAGPGPVPPESPGQADLSRQARITPAESVARITAGLRKAGASEEQVALYLARQDEAKAGVW